MTVEQFIEYLNKFPKDSTLDFYPRFTAMTIFSNVDGSQLVTLILDNLGATVFEPNFAVTLPKEEK